MIGYIYIIITSAMAITAFVNYSYLVTHDINKNTVKFRTQNMVAQVMKDAEEKEQDEIENIFKKFGINMSGKQYQLIRYSVVGVLFLIGVVSMAVEMSFSAFIVLSIITYLITIPQEKFLGMNTVFILALKMYAKSQQTKRDIELYNIVAQLKNISLTTKGNIGIDYVLSEILRFAVHTKPIFANFISLWNMNKRTEAVEYFSDAINTPLGKELGNFLYSFDSLNDEELVDQLEIYQNNVRQERETIRNNERERKANIFYMLAVAIVILIVLNMLIVIIFSDMSEQLDMIM